MFYLWIKLSLYLWVDIISFLKYYVYLLFIYLLKIKWIWKKRNIYFFYWFSGLIRKKSVIF